jgi:spermidine synthase
MSIRTRTAALLLFGSGFCALVYQTAWLRDFRLIFGASTAASAAVLGVFMAGLGFGGIVLGRRVERKTQPLAFYGHLELLIACSAASSPLLIFLARHIYISLGGTTVMGMAIGTLVRLILSAAILGLPTFLMGGTLPAVARAVVSREDASRRALGILYGVNTLGAVTGALAGTFYLFENFGNRLTLWWASGLNIIIALLALRCSASCPPVPTDTPMEVADTPDVSPVRTYFLLVAAGAVGFAFLLMEMVWYRMLAPLFGGSTFAFGLILAIALLGIGFGGVVYSWSGVRRSGSVALFALTCAAEALFIAIPYALGDRIAVAAMLLRPLGTLGFYGHIVAWAALCSIIILPAALVSGFQFPLLISLLGSGRTRIGSQTGAAYAWNTIGALIGSLAGGFGFMPMFSAPGVWRLVVWLLALVATGAALIAALELRRLSRAILPASVAGVAVALLLCTGPTAFWRHGQIGVGGLRQYHASQNDMEELMHRTRRHILWETDGLESSVAVANADSLAFIQNGKSDGNAKTDAGTQVMCGMVGAALHPHPENAMVIGLGTGSTAGWLAAVPTMQRVDAVELEGSIVKVAEQCAPVNHQALHNPKLHVTIGDGREILLTTPRTYDLIVSEPSNPYRAGVAGLFTQEFYQSIEHRLTRGGMFLQWMQTYDVDDRTIEIFYRTLGSVFPNVESWQTEEGDLLLVATREPISYDVEQLRQRLASEPLKSALHGAWHADGLEEFLGHYVANAEVGKCMQDLQPWPLNTDDRTVIEFAFARSVSATTVFHLPNLRAAARVSGRDRPNIDSKSIDWARVREAQISSYVTNNSAEPFQALLTSDELNRAEAFTHYQNGDLASALRSWRAQPAEPRTLSQLALVTECLASIGDPSTGKYVDQLTRFIPLDAEAIRAELLAQLGQPAEAAKLFQQFFRAAHEDAWPDESLIRRSLARAEITAKAAPSKATAREFYDILSTPLAVWNCDADRLARLVTLGLMLDDGRPGKYTAAALQPFEPSVLWQRKFLEIRKTCYENLHDPRATAAAGDLYKFITGQAFSADTAALTRVFKSGGEVGYGTETRKIPRR